LFTKKNNELNDFNLELLRRVGFGWIGVGQRATHSYISQLWSSRIKYKTCAQTWLSVNRYVYWFSDSTWRGPVAV